MFDARRPLGWLFLLLLAMVASAQTLPTTMIVDTVYRADGTPAGGTLLISWPEFTTSAQAAVAAGNTNLVLGAGGALSVGLVANANATPANTVYTVVYQLDDGTVKTEYWVVPTTSPTTISAVRTTLGTGTAASEMATEQYVNNALAGKANDASVVHLAGAETIVGTKQFTVSPSIPAPVNASDAATKEYVDNATQNVGSGSYVSTSGGTMTGPLTLSGDPVAPAQAATKNYVDLSSEGKAALIAGLVPTGELGTGTANNTLCLHGDSSWGGCGSSSNAVSIQNVPVATTTPTNNQVMTYVASLGEYVPEAGGGVTAGMQAVKYATDFNWAQSPATSLSIAGPQTVNLTACASGVTGTEPWYYIYISGTGTAEADLVTGGTCTGNGQPGTLQFTTLNAHAAGYTITSASGGLQEALIAARFVTSNPAGPAQSGKVIVPPGELQVYARVSVRTSNVTVDFSGSIVDCYMNDTCILAGDPSNSTAFLDITLLNPRGRPMLVSGQNPFIEVNAQKTRLLNLTTRTPPTGGTFSSYVQVDNDQSFLLDGLDTALATGSTDYGVLCNATVCNPIIYAPGPFGTNAAVGWLKHLNISLQCAGNGIDWQSGNTVKITDSVIEGFAQYGVRAGIQRGGYSGFEMDNVYEEVGSCTNPVGAIGQAGVIAQGATVKIEGAVAPTGSIPQYANSGSTNYHYYIVAHNTTYGASNPLYAGYALTSGSGNITVTTADIAGASTFDLLRVTYLPPNNPREQAPYGTGNYAVAAGVTRASVCANGVCTFTDTQAALQAYTVSTPSYFPLLNFWPGNLILAANHDSGSVLDAATAWMQDAPSGIAGVQGMAAPAVISANCSSLDFWTPIWLSCYTSMAPGVFYDQGALLLAVKPNQDGGQLTNLKGRLNFPTLGTGPGHIITLSDSNFQKTIATANNRPSNDANDAFIGYDQGNGNPAAVGISLGAPVSLSNYIGNVGDGTSWLERLTSGLKEFKTNVQLDNSLTVAGTAQASSLLTTGAGSWAVQGAYGTLNPPPAGSSAIGFGPGGNIEVSENGGIVMGVATLDSNGDVSQNADTATQLAQPPTQCNGSFVTGIQANGNANCSVADVIELAETGPPAGIPNYGIFWFDSTCHCPKVISNDGQPVQLGLLNVFNLDANTLEEYNGANPQILNVYGTRTDAADYQRLRLGYDTNDTYFVLAADTAGTGGPPAPQPGLGFWLQGSLRWVVDSAFNFKPWSDNIKDVGTPTLRLKHLYAGTYVDTTEGALAIDLPNAATTGTTLNKLAKVTGSPATAIIAATTDSGGIIGIVVDGAGTGTANNAQIARGGQAPCVFDGATTTGDYVQISATVAGDCHDAGASYPGAGQVLGRVLSTNASAGTYTMLVAGSEIQAPAAGAVNTVFGRSGTITAQAGDYSVGLVTGAAALASPAFTGTPTAPTQAASDNSTAIATDAWVKAQGYGVGLTTTGPPTAAQLGIFTSSTNLTGMTLNQGSTLVGGAPGSLPVSNGAPVYSTGIPSADRCAAIHQCATTPLNGAGPVCFAQGEGSSSAPACNSDPFPVQADNVGGGALYLPSGELKVPACADFMNNDFDIHGTAGGNATTGGSTLIPGSGYTRGSGGTFCPFVFNFGTIPAQTGTSGLNGPYSSHVDTLQVSCNSVPGTIGLGIYSGQDNTTIDHIAFSNCPVGALFGGSISTGDGPSVDSVYMVHPSIASCIDNDPGSGGTPQLAGAWTITPNGSSQVPKGLLIMNAPTGGAAGGGGNGIQVYPGVEALIGTDPSCNSASHACATTNRGTTSHATNIDGDYVIGAVSDMMSVTSWSATGAGAANTVAFTLNGTNDFPSDNYASCASGYTPSANCNRNGIVYLSGGADSTYNGCELTIYSRSGSSVTGWLSCAVVSGHTSGTTMNAAYANSIDPVVFLGTPFTAANQIAMNFGTYSGGVAGCSGAPSGTVTSYDCAPAGGTLISYSNGVNIDTPDSFRPFHQWTFTSTGCQESANTEYPAHNLSVSGASEFTLDGDSHFEATKLEAIVIGKDGPTANVSIDNVSVVSNDGWSQSSNNGGGPGPTSGHSSAIRIFNRFSPSPYSIKLTRINVSASTGGANQPTNVIQDDINNNTILSTACPVADYEIDQSGGVTTNCPASSINNGISINNGTITVMAGGVAVMQLGATANSFVAAALTGNSTSVTPSTSDSSTKIATTAFVKNQGYAPLASPTFSGTPVVPGYAKTGTLVSGNYPSASGSGTIGDSTVLAGPYSTIGIMLSPSGASTTSPVGFNSTSGKAQLWGFYLNAPVTTTTAHWFVVGADTASCTYDIGILNTAGNIVAHTGNQTAATLGMTGASAFHSYTWASSATLQPGKYYLAITASATSGCATLGYTFNATFASNVAETVTSGGTLNNGITIPSDAWTDGNTPVFIAN